MKKIYHITGYLYVPLDMDVLANNKIEAAKRYKEICNGHETGYDFEPRVHGVAIGGAFISDPKELEEEDYLITVNNFVF